MKSFKPLFARALAAAPGRLHFAAHSHHLWPDASYEGQLQAWDDAAALADKKWDKIFGAIMPEAQAHIARELALPDPGTIAFAPNTHELLVRLISARKPGPIDVLTSDGEFHSFRRQAARWAEEDRVRLRTVPCEPFESFTERFLAAMAEKAPDIAFLSHVMFKSGLRFDGAEALAAYAHPERTWIVLDLYHAFMAMPADFSAVADRVFLLGGGYKYAMAGEGAGFIHAPPGFGPRPAYTGWFADFVAIEQKQQGVAYAENGGRFLGATFDPSGLYRFNAVQQMLARDRLDTQAIATHVAGLRTALEAEIASGGAGPLREAEMLRPNAYGWQARFLALRHPSAAAWKAKLMDANIITDARDDVLRIGLGLYHDAADITEFCAAVKEALA
ncbi:MAG TPA: aminotransferase class V-fold PLP-dependent enzyme [Terricaulis sp.]|nr:aminotransferase class V-fold PLP-dependent enzyme [Terricaulis sp.]